MADQVATIKPNIYCLAICERGESEKIEIIFSLFIRVPSTHMYISGMGASTHDKRQTRDLNEKDRAFYPKALGIATCISK